MSVMLPVFPQPAQAEPSYLDWGGVISSPLGGADQKLNRLGDRFAVSVTMPPMESAGVAREWIAALIRAQKEGAVLRFPQPGLDLGNPGFVSIDGGGQSGTTLHVVGSQPNYGYRVGQFLSVVHNSRSYLHIITADAVGNGSGKATLGIAPMIRARYADGAGIDMRAFIEGFLEGNSRDWTIDLAMNVGLSFRITEAE